MKITKLIVEQKESSPHLRDYAGGGGRVMWVQGNPFVSVWASLWMIHTGAIASRINLAPRDPKRVNPGNKNEF